CFYCKSLSCRQQKSTGNDLSAAVTTFIPRDGGKSLVNYPALCLGNEHNKQPGGRQNIPASNT
ncbi:hypothetical protein, partial [Serratia sp. Se-RSmG]|uniref:hypothetical protein n=1 Tax=Serratia sp. Se-RSmG TaxID=3043307 RepID=UPI0024AFEF3F